MTWGEQYGELGEALPLDLPDDEIRELVDAAIEGGRLEGIDAEWPIDLSGHRIDRFPADADAPWARILLRPRPVSHAPRVVVCGVGALGSALLWVGRNLPVRWVALDRAPVAAGDLAFLSVGPSGVGLPRPVAAQIALRAYGAEIETELASLDTADVASLLAGATLVVDCLDEPAGRVAIARWARSVAHPCLHGALGHEGGAFCWNSDFELSPAPRHTVGPADLPAVVELAARMAAELQRWLVRA